MKSNVVYTEPVINLELTPLELAILYKCFSDFLGGTGAVRFSLSDGFREAINACPPETARKIEAVNGSPFKGEFHYSDDLMRVWENA